MVHAYSVLTPWVRDHSLIDWSLAITGLDGHLEPRRRQAILSVRDRHAPWRMAASLGLNVFPVFALRHMAGNKA